MWAGPEGRSANISCELLYLWSLADRVLVDTCMGNRLAALAMQRPKSQLEAFSPLPYLWWEVKPSLLCASSSHCTLFSSSWGGRLEGWETAQRDPGMKHFPHISRMPRYLFHWMSEWCNNWTEAQTLLSLSTNAFLYRVVSSASRSTTGPPHPNTRWVSKSRIESVERLREEPVCKPSACWCLHPPLERLQDFSNCPCG